MTTEIDVTNLKHCVAQHQGNRAAVMKEPKSNNPYEDGDILHTIWAEAHDARTEQLTSDI